MEPAPLILGHSHARNALHETHKSNAVAASEEHDLAAGEFARAAKDTGDAEALRTLRLLEEHHQKLAQLLRFRTKPTVGIVASEAPQPDVSPEPSARRGSDDQADPTRSSSPYRNAQQPPSLSSHSRAAPRDLTSSIASSLASARGIPSKQQRRGAPISPTITTQHAGGRLLSPPGRSRVDELRERSSATSLPRKATSNAHSESQQPSTTSTDLGKGQLIADEPMASQQKAGEDPFQRFYSTFENFLSKISAPLAFAGLPLGNEETSSAGMQGDKVGVREEPKTEPNMNNLFSRAALRALRDESGGHGFGAAESFYVVPTTGGTISYAGILSRAERARLENEAHSDEFVDARESPGSPTISRNTKTMEELQLENQALRALSDQLSKRLHMWEVNAQSSSMALQQSLRAIGSDERVKELEEQIKAGRKEMERMARENEKLKGVVARYREQWERLKQGARDRRDGSAGT